MRLSEQSYEAVKAQRSWSIANSAGQEVPRAVGKSVNSLKSNKAACGPCLGHPGRFQLLDHPDVCSELWFTMMRRQINNWPETKTKSSIHTSLDVASVVNPSFQNGAEYTEKQNLQQKNAPPEEGNTKEPGEENTTATKSESIHRTQRPWRNTGFSSLKMGNRQYDQTPVSTWQRLKKPCWWRQRTCDKWVVRTHFGPACKWVTNPH